MENIFLWIFADICKPMLQAKRLLAVVVGSHDTQQHELSLKEGDKVSVVMIVMTLLMVLMLVIKVIA